MDSTRLCLITSNCSAWISLIALTLLFLAAAIIQATAQESLKHVGNDSLDRHSTDVSETPEVSGFIVFNWSYRATDRPAPLQRTDQWSQAWLSSQINVVFAEGVELPITMLVASQNTEGSMAPSLSSLAVSPVMGPGNVLIEPQFGWAKVSLGRFAPRLSTLSGDGVAILGGALDLRPGAFRLFVAAGRSNAFLPYNSINSESVRTLVLASLGVGDDSVSNFRLNAVRAKDDLQQSVGDSWQAPAGEGLLLSTSFAQTLADGIGIDGEIAGTMYTRDLRSSELADADQPAPEIFRLRTSTRFDAAAAFGAHVDGHNWGMILKSSYIGPGYVTLAGGFSDQDRVEVSVAPRLTLLDGQLRINGTLAWRGENLSRTIGLPSNRLTASANVSTQVTQTLSLTATWNMFHRGYCISATLPEVSIALQSLSLLPSAVIISSTILHTISGQIGFDTYDYATGDSNTFGSLTTSIGTTYMASLLQLPLSFELGAWYSGTDDPRVGSQSVSAHTGVSYRFPKQRLTLSLSGAWNTITRTSTGRLSSLLVRTSLSWNILPNLGFLLSASAAPYNDNQGVHHVPITGQSSMSWNF